MLRLTSAAGLLVMILLAWLLSSNRRRFPVRVVVGGVTLQLTVAGLILKTETGRRLFTAIGNFFTTLLSFVDQGCVIVFGDRFRDFYFAFRVLPTIIFFSSLIAILYHFGIIQWVVRILAKVMQVTLRTSGAESLSAAANIFVGQTEAPLVIQPYIRRMTVSELMSVMVGGFATVAGGVLAVYIGFGIPARHLITASFISAPAGLVIAKVMQPESEQTETSDETARNLPRETTNVIEAATQGAAEGLKLALNVGAMMIAFLALIALLDYLLGTTSGWIMTHLLNMTDRQPITLSWCFGRLFAPLAFVMGIEPADCLASGELLGLKMAANELVAYQRMSVWSVEADALATANTIHLQMASLQPGCTGIAVAPAASVIPDQLRGLSPRSIVIMTYALSGFANFASIGIQVGGIGGLAPERRKDLARLGLRAMLGGTLACCMTACVAGMLI
ncbi:MAG: hypothetical protein KDA96_22850 [Planctomycetaceae bacterium]|nr:hypothetical protein [Planctomycetaceae bacterium]